MPDLSIQYGGRSYKISAPDQATAESLIQDITQVTPVSTETASTVESERVAREAQMQSLAEEANRYETAGTILSSIGQGLAPYVGTFTDELGSLIEAPFSEQTYSQIQAEKERQLAAGREASPLLALGSEVVPGLLTGSVLSKALTTAPRTVAKIGEYVLGPTGKTTAKLPQVLASQTLQGATYGAGAAEQGEGVEGALLGGATGLGTAAGLRLASNLVRGTAEKLKESGQRIQRTSLGVRPSDYAKTSTRSGTIEIDLPIDETDDVTVSQLVTKTKQAVDDVIASKELPETRDPGQLGAFVINKLKDISTKTADAIRRKDEELAANRTLVKFVNTDKTKKLIKTGRYSTDEQNEIINAIEDIKKQFDEASPGEELILLQQAKQGLTSKYKETSDKMAAAYRQLYNDFKTHIESYVPEVKNLNKQNQKWQYVQKPIFRELAKSEGFNDLEEIRRLLYTTGGIAAPMLLGAGLGAAGSEGDAAGGALRGALVGGTLKYASQPEQAAKIGRILEAAGNLGTSPTAELIRSKLADALVKASVRGATIPTTEITTSEIPTIDLSVPINTGGITPEQARAELERRKIERMGLAK